MIEVFGLQVAIESLLSPLAILVSALIGGTVALWAIFTNRQLAKLKNSMDFANGFNKDKEILSQFKIVVDLESASSTEIANLAHNLNDPKAVAIRTVLNYGEAVAICIKHKIYQDKVIKEAIYSTFEIAWETCEPYVKERRKKEKKDTYFQEFEQLYKRWKANPLKAKNEKRFFFF